MKALAPDPAGPLLSLLQLQRRARQAATPEALGFVAVNETLQLAPYRQAALWIDAGLGRVAAVSGLPSPDPTAPYVQWLTQALRHLARSGTAAGPLVAQGLPDAMQADWADWQPVHSL